MTDEELESVKRFVDNYKNQSNLGTRDPIAYVVQHEKEVVNPAGYGGEDRYIYDNEALTQAEYDELPEREQEKCDLVSIDKDWFDVQWFFTEEEAKNYIIRDGHNLGKTRLYVKHWYRNSEAELILTAMFSLVGEDFSKFKRT